MEPFALRARRRALEDAAELVAIMADGAMKEGDLKTCNRLDGLAKRICDLPPPSPAPEDAPSEEQLALAAGGAVCHHSPADRCGECGECSECADIMRAALRAARRGK